MDHQLEMGMLKAKVAHLEKGQEKLEKNMIEVIQWQWKAMGFFAAVSFLVHGFLIYLEMKGWKQ